MIQPSSSIDPRRLREKGIINRVSLRSEVFDAFVPPGLRRRADDRRVVVGVEKGTTTTTGKSRRDRKHGKKTFDEDSTGTPPFRRFLP